MSINLTKGGSINLSKDEPTLKKVMIGLGWDLSDASIDLDASIFMLGPNSKLPSSEYFVFYNNLKSPDGAVQHTGDNRTGEGDGDDEMILANLDLISPNVHEVLILVTMHDAYARRQNFTFLKNAYIRLYDVVSKREICRYNLTGDLGPYGDMEFGKLQKVNNDWKFVALGNGSNKGLQGFVDIYA